MSTFTGTSNATNAISTTPSMIYSASAGGWVAPVTSAISISGGTVNIAGGTVTGAKTNQRATLTVPELHVSGDKPTITTDRGAIDLNRLHDFMERAERILCLLEEDMRRHDAYPALKEAYDHYRVLDRLCRDDDEE